MRERVQVGLGYANGARSLKFLDCGGLIRCFKTFQYVTGRSGFGAKHKKIIFRDKRHPVQCAGMFAGRHAFVYFGGSFSCPARSEEHTSELQSLMRNSYAVFYLK